MNHKTKAAALVGALLVLAPATPAMAAPRPAVDLRGAEVGTYALATDGTAHLTGRVTGVPFDGRYTATLSSADGSLPAPGECEPGTAAVHVNGRKHRSLDLAATGDICGRWADATYVVTHEFVGRYVVTHTSVRKARGTDGWISLILATEGRANLEAIDT
jgi:hypothetical protein